MRSYSSQGLALLRGERLVVAHLLEFWLTAGNPMRFNTSSMELDALGVHWFPGHGLFELTFPAEDSSLEAHEATITLSAMNPAMLGQALTAKVKGKFCNIYQVIFNPDTLQIAEIQLEFFGRMSALTIVSGATDSNA